MQHLYKYVTPEVAKSILDRREVWYSSPLTFNDPFDLQVDPEVPFTTDQLRVGLAAEVRRLCLQKEEPQFSGEGLSKLVQKMRALQLSPAQLDAVTDKGFQRAMDGFAQHAERFRAMWKPNMEACKVFCLGETHDNLLMWSHYARSHQGAVLRFHITPETPSPLIAVEPVRYQRSLPRLATLYLWVSELTGQDVRHDQHVQNFLLTKADYWAYEREWRAVAQRPSLPIEDPLKLPLARTDIDAIYFGCKCKPEDRAEIAQLASGNLEQVTIYQGRKSTSEYGLEFEEVA